MLFLSVLTVCRAFLSACRSLLVCVGLFLDCFSVCRSLWVCVLLFLAHVRNTSDHSKSCIWVFVSVCEAFLSACLSLCVVFFREYFNT